MEELQVFESPEFGKIRTIEIDGDVWFVGKDVAEILGYSNTRDAMNRHVDTEDKNSVVIHDGIPGNPNQTVINESGVYSLILSSKLPKAKEFKHWVTSEILPSIRKHGAYMTHETLTECLQNPENLITLLTQLKAEQDARIAAEQKAKCLDAENAALAARELEWDKKSFVNAAVRRLAMAMPSYYTDVRFKQAWTRFKQELLYNHSINLELRYKNILKTSKHPSKLKLIDAIDEEIADTCVTTITAMCREHEINVDDLLQNIPA